MSEALEFFQFEVRGIDPVSREPFRGALSQFAICTAAQARVVAKEHEDNLARTEPERQIKVRPVGLEKVGPRIQQHMAMMGFQARRNATVARLLAASLATHAARESLQLNPDLPAIAEKLLADAMKAADEALRREAGQPLLGPEGQPMTAEGSA